MELLHDGPDSGPTILLAPGASAGMDTPWMREFAGMLGARGIHAVRFEFAYVTARRLGTGGGGQPRAEAVVDEFREAVQQVGGAMVIGGKSFGGRVASLVADELHAAGTVTGLVCLGYPFHPPDKPDQLRTAHLEQLATPALICQGTRDPFGTRDQVVGYALSDEIRMHWLEDGDHGFTPRKAISGRTARQNLDEAADAVTAFTSRVLA